MHMQLRKVPYVPDQKRYFSVIVTDRTKSNERLVKHDLRVEALSPAAAEYQALRSYLLLCTPAEQERLIENGLVTASVLTDVDEQGRVVPFDNKRFSGPIRVMILVGAVLFGCVLIWLLMWLTMTGLNQVWDLLEATVNPVKSG